jgi:hypothetical protein
MFILKLKVGVKIRRECVCDISILFKIIIRLTVSLMQALSQRCVQASWDAPRTKSGRLWTPKFRGKRVIIFNDFPKYINISETN